MPLIWIGLAALAAGAAYLLTRRGPSLGAVPNTPLPTEDDALPSGDLFSGALPHDDTDEETQGEPAVPFTFPQPQGVMDATRTPIGDAIIPQGVKASDLPKGGTPDVVAPPPVTLAPGPILAVDPNPSPPKPVTVKAAPPPPDVGLRAVAGAVDAAPGEKKGSPPKGAIV